MTTTITISRTVVYTDTFVFNRELTPEELDKFTNSHVDWEELEAACDDCYEEEVDSSTRSGYDINVIEKENGTENSK